MAYRKMRRPHRDEEVDAVEALVRAQADPLRIESGDGVERHELQPAVLVRQQAARHARAAPDSRPTHTLYGLALQAEQGLGIQCSMTESKDVSCSQHSLSAVRLRGAPVPPRARIPTHTFAFPRCLQPLKGCMAPTGVPFKNTSFGIKVSCAKCKTPHIDAIFIKSVGVHIHVPCSAALRT